VIFVSAVAYAAHISRERQSLLLQSMKYTNMMPSDHTMAVIARRLQVTLFTALILYFGKTLFIPMFYGLLIALVMYPVNKRLERKGWSKALSTTVSLTVVALLFVLLIVLLVWQLSVFWHDWPQIARKLGFLLQEIQAWITEQTGVTLESQMSWLHNAAMNAGNMLSGMLRDTLSATVNIFFILFMTLIFAALFLYHRRVFVRYLQQALGPRHRRQLDLVLRELIHTYFNYIKGMVMVYIIVGALNSIGLLALGIRHAILFGMLTAIMTIIPYVGIIVSALLPISVAWTTKGSLWYPVGVIGVFSFVQYLEANVIFPKIVGAQLNVSTWATLVAILAGGILWGVSGMILFIPFAAIAKIITDHVPEWKGLNILLSRHPAKL
jgi:predicted PurR-regulated permease PerM